MTVASPMVTPVQNFNVWSPEETESVMVLELVQPEVVSFVDRSTVSSKVASKVSGVVIIL